ncbi:hypothetical protein TrLO_g3312 [Triparma laevis f. longispina]|uniref:Uncharacterized protein n=1 Tax=Triparma laevis f. longispina TaxID=1714387 RepID=A0A9W7KVY7_9STRA|nr:hypothetical protein TrLO_g3312 [Triparma laevis f. longispina]
MEMNRCILHGSLFVSASIALNLSLVMLVDGHADIPDHIQPFLPPPSSTPESRPDAVELELKRAAEKVKFPWMSVLPEFGDPHAAKPKCLPADLKSFDFLSTQSWARPGCWGCPNC